MRRSLHTGTRVVRDIWTHPGNAGRRVRAVSTFGLWQLWERTIRRPWTAEVTPTRRIVVRPHTPTASAFLYYRRPDFEEMTFIEDWMQPGDMFIDVGANIGAYTLIATQRPRCRAIAFEPDPNSREMLMENLRMNQLIDRVDVVSAAVANTSGRGRLTVGLGPVNALVDDESTTVRTRTVQVTTLDEALDGIRPSAVKLDVEGREVDVLNGARQLIGSARPALVIENNHPDRLRKVLDELGYTVVHYDPARNRLDEAQVPARPGGNVIAVDDLGSATDRIGAA